MVVNVRGSGSRQPAVIGFQELAAQPNVLVLPFIVLGKQFASPNPTQPHRLPHIAPCYLISRSNFIRAGDTIKTIMAMSSFAAL